jgi:hypothetical protein
MRAGPKETVRGGVEQLAGKYLTFVLDGQSCGLDGLRVREIIRRPVVTAVPEMPAYFRGVINLRGKIIPILDQIIGGEEGAHLAAPPTERAHGLREAIQRSSAKQLNVGHSIAD